MKPGNFYQVLGLSPSASTEEIRKAYLTYAAKFHPDKHAGDPFFEERFKEVKEAYEFLSDAEKRWQYDVKTFGKSKVKRESQKNNFIPEAKSRKRFAFEIRHLDQYLTAFYFINVSAWLMVRKAGDQGSAGNYAWSLFISGLSSLFFWLFVNGWVEKNYRKSVRARLFWIGYLLVSIFLLAVVLVG